MYKAKFTFMLILCDLNKNKQTNKHNIFSILFGALREKDLLCDSAHRAAEAGAAGALSGTGGTS